MNIDKRSSIRKPVVLSVEIYSFNEHLGHTRTRDISLDGSFIETCSKKLYPDDLLELYFNRHAGDRRPLCLRATVVRSTDEGVGVEFDYGVEEYRRLLNTISSYASDGRALNLPGFWSVSSSVD